ncbi:hypothetical protein [Gloeocapsopsis sp. IPPAS B-1203]|uniref:hypothetical protein n=1 Tax=Gloeocapsopsis sp. IPPAS B-1203 TaxID=2049454 RepID=UPI000C191206|nr:hypothetical protein [Gloeocapsopsis sp. IPPAS B-1203]PIG94589.1 hypothetical protein CSQ79_04745 [Gloeocapsopsis sp. IPPAS B-1203]
MSGYKIDDNKTSSAIFAKFADRAYALDFVGAMNELDIALPRLANRIVADLKPLVNKINQGWQFFKRWWQDDPVGATAGGIAAVLTVGVVVVVGGKVLGTVAGGISALRTIKLLTLAKNALYAATAAGIVGSLIRFAVRGVQRLWTFNWNVTDKQLREQQNSLMLSLIGQMGEAAGTGVGALLCGSAPIEIAKRTNLVRVNPMMLARIRELTEFDPQSDNYGELYEETMESVKALVSVGNRVFAQIMFMEAYKNIRKWIKNYSKDTKLGLLFPGLAQLIEQWGEEGSQAWSFASAIEERIESIPDDRLRIFTEEFYEGFTDSCTESAMIISYVF